MFEAISNSLRAVRTYVYLVCKFLRKLARVSRICIFHVHLMRMKCEYLLFFRGEKPAPEDRAYAQARRKSRSSRMRKASSSMVQVLRMPAAVAPGLPALLHAVVLTMLDPELNQFRQ